MLARLAEQVSCFLEKGEKIGATIRRADLKQAPLRLDDDTIHMLHADPVSVIRSMNPAPYKVLLRRADPSTTSPLRVGYDSIAATLGDEVYLRRRADQAECPICGRWADLRPVPALVVLLCRSAACGSKFTITAKSDRWVSVAVSLLLKPTDVEKYFLPREWNKSGPWITREDLEKKYQDWLKIKEEF
jgi:hypothetical protein